MPADSPLFSVIIATRDRPKEVIRAIRSVLVQSFPDFEVIVIDDGSRMAMQAALGELVSSRVICFRNKVSLGPAKARWIGVNEARGQYCCFLDDDDYYLPDHLQGLRDLAQRHNSKTALLCSGMQIHARGRPKQIANLWSKHSSALTGYWFAPFNLLPFAIPTLKFTAEIEQLQDSPDEDFIEDFQWLCKLLATTKVIYHAVPTVVYTRQEASRTNSRTDREALIQRCAVINRLASRPAIRRELPPNAVAYQLAHQCLHWTNQCIRNYQWLDAGWGLRKALPHLTWKNIPSAIHTCLLALRTFMNRHR